MGEANELPGHILINVLSPDGEGLPGIRIRIEWDEGSDTVITGLHPDGGAGYADFEMVSDRAYAVFVAGAQSEKATGLAASAAGDNAGVRPESWQVVFSRLP